MKFAKKKDFIIAAVIIVSAVILWIFTSGALSKKDGTRAEIYYDSELVKTVELTEGETYEFSIEQLPHVVFRVYEDGSIAFAESDCPDKVCVNTGRLHYVGQTAACLPNRVYIKIVGDTVGDDEPDIVVG